MPTTDDIRLAWAVYHDRRKTRDERGNTALWETMRDDAYADFDRWLAQHDREVGAQAIRDEASAISGYTLNFESGFSIYQQVLGLMRRDADIKDPNVDDLAFLRPAVVGSTPEGQKDA